MSISPQYAENLLEKNTINRPLSMGHVESIAKDIREGRWKMNGESIIISKTGKLLDGQHRLTAVVRSGKSITSVVVRGVEDEYMQSIGVGKKRSTANILSMSGCKNCTTLAGTARQFALMKAGLAGVKLAVTAAEVTDIVKNNPCVEMATEWLSGCLFSRRSAISGAYAYIVSRHIENGVSQNKVHEFFDRLKTGVGLSDGSPIYHLRQKLEKWHRAKSQPNDKEILCCIFRAWNLYAKNKSIGRLSYDDTVPEVMLQSWT